MLDNHDALLVLQGSAAEKLKETTDGYSRKGHDTGTQSSTHDDKVALARLLRPGLADMRAHGQAIDLNTNEELPRMVPILCSSFTSAELSELFGEAMMAKMQTIYQTEMLQNLYLEFALKSVLRAFNEAQISLLLFKGPALAYQYYAQPHLRTYHDIDAFIQPANLARARDLLLQQGFKYYEEFRSNATDETRSGYNFILKQADSWLEILVELHTAPHSSDIGSQFDVQALWQNAQKITLLDEPVLMMHYVDHLLYLCWHYRFHGFTRLIWLYDLVVMVRVSRMELDWAALVSRAREINLATTLYYCLLWCRDLFDVAIPDSVFKQLRPPLISQLVIERIAMPDAAKALVSARLQPQRILARRFMVDRSLDLLKAGARALFPSKAAIGRRYMSHSRLPLQLYFVFYIIHPWITIAKGLHFLFRKRSSQP